MTPETLETLLLDRALGALPAETAALLEVYLAHDADAATRAHALVTTVQDARAALQAARPRESGAARLPAFPRQQVAAARRHRAAWRMGAQSAALAACVLLGLGIGWSLRGQPFVQAGDGKSAAMHSPGGDGRATPAGHSFAVESESPAAKRLARVENRFWSVVGAWQRRSGALPRALRANWTWNMKTRSTRVLGG